MTSLIPWMISQLPKLGLNIKGHVYVGRSALELKFKASPSSNQLSVFVRKNVCGGSGCVLLCACLFVITSVSFTGLTARDVTRRVCARWSFVLETLSAGLRSAPPQKNEISPQVPAQAAAPVEARHRGLCVRDVPVSDAERSGQSQPAGGSLAQGHRGQTGRRHRDGDGSRE